MPRARLLLIASLVLNIFLLGAIGGGMWRWSHARGGRVGWRAAVFALPRSQADGLRARMRAAVQASRPVARDAVAARGEAARLFVQPRFDAPAVLAALDRARADDALLRARVEQGIVGYAATLPQPARRTLADALRHGPLRQPRRRPD